MAKQFKAAANRGEELGLTADEMAFYDALAANEASVLELGDETLRKIARELSAFGGLDDSIDAKTAKAKLWQQKSASNRSGLWRDHRLLARIRQR
jgi:type I site-specific restriction-modification system R (restriction) subunit